MTSKAPEVKKFPGVRQVPGSVNWHYWKKHPEDLLGHPQVGGKQWAFRGSLGTANLREANARAAAKLAELEAFWGTLRAAHSLTLPSSLQPEAVQAIALGVRALVLAEDEELRADPVRLAKSLKQWWDSQEQQRKLSHEVEGLPTPYRPVAVPYELTPRALVELEHWPKWKGTHPVLHDLLTTRHKCSLELSKATMSRGAPGPLILLAERSALSLGINLGVDGWLSAEAHALRLACLSAYRQALEGLTQRDEGIEVVTPAVSVMSIPVASQGPQQVLSIATSAGTLSKPLNQIRLRDVLPLWIDERKPTTGTQAKAEKALRDYERLSGNPTLDRLNKQLAGAYGAALVKEGQARNLSGNTLASYLNIIKGIGTVASNKLDGFVENPFKAVTMPEIAPTERIEFSIDDLKKIFNRAVWQSYEVPLTADTGADAAYWVPVIALFTGARLSEIAQLWCRDVKEVDGIPCMHLGVINEPGDKCKTKAANRVIPVHPELIRLGLLEFVQDMQAAGSDYLFPATSRHLKTGKGEKLSSWFNAMIRAEGFPESQVFHCFRNTAKTTLSRNKQRGHLVNRYGGWETREMSVGDKVYDGYGYVSDMLEVVTIGLTFPDVPLPRVYTKPIWAPGWNLRAAKKAAKG